MSDFEVSANTVSISSANHMCAWAPIQLKLIVFIFFFDSQKDDFEDDFEEYISDEEPTVKSSPVVASPMVAAPKSSSTPVPNEPLSRQVKEMMKAMEQENSSLRSASPSQAPSSASNNSGNSSLPNQSATSPAVPNPSMLQAKTIKIDKPLTKEELKQQELARKKAERSRVRICAIGNILIHSFLSLFSIIIFIRCWWSLSVGGGDGLE